MNKIIKIAPSKKNLRTCPNGHAYYKSSDCPTCPVCEEQRKPMSGFLSKLSAPARRALENNQITSLQKLSEFKEAEILKLHGIGPTAMPKLREALKQEGLSFNK
ncbi:MAG TPA: RNA polymerase alpha subunit C-terminal domain-containing protein [Parafilimonas sp.]|nr:RNA polymerase alpha subunit C-terminal domain-containing protein [Parafilimonas sp.]